MNAHISQLWVYPIKGCAGQSMQSSVAVNTGLAHDRQLMVVDALTGRFITQRSHPRMALIQPHLVAHTLHISATGFEHLVLDLTQSHGLISVTVWRDTLPAIDLGDAPAAWFSQVLGHAVRLVRFAPQQQRLCRGFAPGQLPAHHYFADGYPYLVISQASLHALNERLLEAGSHIVGMDRFRPNIVITGVEAHTEDYAASFTHDSGVVLHMVSPCTRCTVPTINQQTAQPAADGQPSLALAQYRYDSVQDGVVFGMNAQLSMSHAAHNHVPLLHVGDTLKVTLAF